MKTTWLLSAATVCLATFQLTTASPIDAKKKSGAPLKDVSVVKQLPKEELEQILKSEPNPEEVLHESFIDADRGVEDLQPANVQSACVSRDCIGASYRILSNMNNSVDPCDDFYQFSCGRYIAETAIPSDKGKWTAFDPVGEEIYLRGRALLESSAQEGDFESYQLIRDHYKSCINEEKLEELGVKPLQKLLKGFGGWPVLEGEEWQGEDFKWWEWTYKMNDAGLGIDSIVGLSLGADDKNASYRTLGLDQATPGLSREYLVKGFDNKDVQYYYRYMVDTAVLLGADQDYAEEELKKSLLFEIELANILLPREERRNATLLYNPTTLADLQTYEGLPPSWTEYFQNLYKNTDLQITEDERIIVTNFEYHEKLSGLLKKTDNKVVANYLAWVAAKSLMTYLNKEARDIKQKFERGITGVQESSPTWKRCVNEMGFNSFSGGGFGFVAGSMYAKKYFNKEAKAAMLEMTAYIRTAFKEDVLEHLDWMDAKTKKRARAKMEKMDQFIAYSDEFLVQEKVDGLHQGIAISEDDYLGNTLNLIKFWRRFYYNRLREKVDPKSWIEHSLVTVVNAFYNPGQNNMEFPAGILQGVFFNANVPKYLNFAAIGTVIGHEITHGFDDQGKQRNENGEIENWWEPATEESYKERAQCIIDQYGGYEAKQVGEKLNGINNQGENIADNGGLKEAYKAYLRWVADNEDEQVLAGLPYNQKQMFWISFGQVWCSKFKDESLKQQILTGYHSPGEFRVTGSLQNNVDFAKDFNCPLGSRMNPEKKCSVW